MASLSFGNTGIGISVDPEKFSKYCSEVVFHSGETIFTYGRRHHYFYILIDGVADLHFKESGAAPCVLAIGGGTTLGESGFLTGRASRLYAIARTPVRALRVDDRAWAGFERDFPAEAARVRREISDVARVLERLDPHGFAEATDGVETGIEIVLCRNAGMLRTAHRLRDALRHDGPERGGAGADDLDDRAFVFVAFYNGAPVGLIRVNRACDGLLGEIATLYGMTASRRAARTVVCTQFLVKDPGRCGRAGLALLGAALAWSMEENMAECFLDCAASLLPFYKALGLKEAAPAFRGVDGERFYPLVLDLERDGAKVVGLLNSRATDFS